MDSLLENDAFNKIAIPLPYSQAQKKNFEACNSLLQPGELDKVKKVEQFCAPNVMDKLLIELDKLLTNGRVNEGLQGTFLAI
jgi:hypothetical protein